MGDVPPYQEPDWIAFRKRVRRRQAAMATFVLGPFVLLVTLWRALKPHDYPQGDLRNEPLLWAAMALVAMLFVGAFIVHAVRVLRDEP